MTADQSITRPDHGILHQNNCKPPQFMNYNSLTPRDLIGVGTILWLTTYFDQNAALFQSKPAF